MLDCAALTDRELDLASQVLANYRLGETGRKKPYQDIGLSGPDRFQLATPDRMQATNDLSFGHRREPKDLALTRRYVRPNTNNRVSFLTFDIDRPDAWCAWEEANVAAPHAVVVNPENGHAHLIYQLRAAVSTSTNSRPGPVLYLEAIARGMTHRLGADPGFRNYLIKNPLHPYWRTWWVQSKPYTLQDLAVFLEPEDMQIIRHTRGTEFAEAGRNCWLTSNLSTYGLRTAWQHRDSGMTFEGFRRVMTHKAFELNQTFDAPLGSNEVLGIVRSISRWAWQKSTAAVFSEIQRNRALIRRRRNERILAGIPNLSELTSGEVARILGCTPRNARNYHAVPRAQYEANSLSRKRPWEALEISRATYYRLKRAGLL